MQKVWLRVVVVFSTLLLTTCLFGQSGPSSDSSASPVNPATQEGPAPKPGRIGIGVKASLLGGGIEVATPITRRSNVRAGFNMFSYSRNFSKSGIGYDGQLSFRTMEAHYDFYPFAGSFRVSGGLLSYLTTPLTAKASVPGGSSFTLNGVTYYADSAGVTGNAAFNLRKVAPTVSVGWGNLLPRSSKHFSIPVELGVAFQGSPNAALSLTGNVCSSPGVGCQSTSNSTVQSNIQGEQTKLNNSMSLFKFYPILSVGFGYKF